MENQKAEFIERMFREIGITLSSEQVGTFFRLYEYMIDYNNKVNLTAITDFEEVVIKHFIDSVLPFKMAGISGDESFIDVGTGAGFPALPLLICFPGLQGTLCDSLAKRCLYLELVCKEIGVTAEIIHARGEELGRKRREAYDFAAARAVAALPVLSELCLPFVKVGGRFIALKSVSEGTEASHNAFELLGGREEKCVDYSLPNNDGRRLIIVKKLSQTPTKYPRSCANITKKPL